MAGKQYMVVGAMASAKIGTNEGARVIYFYEGAVLPDGVDEESIKHLLDVGLIAEADGSGSSSSDGSGAPAKSASKADWVDHAVSEGMSRSDAEAATKEDLVEAYGS